MEHCRLTDDALAGVFEAFALGPGPANGRRPDLGGEGLAPHELVVELVVRREAVDSADESSSTGPAAGTPR